MLTLPSGIKIWMAKEAINMHASFDGLAALAEKTCAQSVFEGHLFIFHNKRSDKIKILYWDRNGFVQWYKRLEKGVFRFPKIGEAYRLTLSELNLLLEGIDLTEKKRFNKVNCSSVN